MQQNVALLVDNQEHPEKPEPVDDFKVLLQTERRGFHWILYDCYKYVKHEK